jgi:hypothetical protein
MEQKESKWFKIPECLLRRNYMKSELGWYILLKSPSDAVHGGPGFQIQLFSKNELKTKI